MWKRQKSSIFHQNVEDSLPNSQIFPKKYMVVIEARWEVVFVIIFMQKYHHSKTKMLFGQKVCLRKEIQWSTARANSLLRHACLDWVLHIAKVGYFFSPSLPNMEWLILGPFLFFFFFIKKRSSSVFRKIALEELICIMQWDDKKC